MGNINKIRGIKAKIEHYDKNGIFTEFIEMNEDFIATYRKNKGSRKILGLSQTPITKSEMKSFFNEIYDFVRTASEEDDWFGDTKYEVELIYSGFHSETLRGITKKGNEVLFEKLIDFVNEHRN